GHATGHPGRGGEAVRRRRRTGPGRARRIHPGDHHQHGEITGARPSFLTHREEGGIGSDDLHQTKGQVMMERIVYLDHSALRTAVRRPAFEHEWIEYATSRPEVVKARLEGATIAITHRVFMNGEDLPPTLGLIAVGATGTERIDLAACRARGVQVCNVRGWSVSVSEHFFALALALRRNLLAYHSAVRSGAWSSSPDFSLATEPFGHTLRGDALGIIGFGTLGRSVAQIGRGLGMDVLVAERKGAATPRVGRVPFHE